MFRRFSPGAIRKENVAALLISALFDLKESNQIKEIQLVELINVLIKVSYVNNELPSEDAVSVKELKTIIDTVVTHANLVVAYESDCFYNEILLIIRHRIRFMSRSNLTKPLISLISGIGLLISSGSRLDITELSNDIYKEFNSYDLTKKKWKYIIYSREFVSWVTNYLGEISNRTKQQEDGGGVGNSLKNSASPSNISRVPSSVPSLISLRSHMSSEYDGELNLIKLPNPTLSMHNIIQRERNIIEELNLEAAIIKVNDLKPINVFNSLQTRKNNIDFLKSRDADIGRQDLAEAIDDVFKGEIASCEGVNDRELLKEYKSLLFVASRLIVRRLME